MEARASGCPQITAAAKAGFSDRTGRRIEAGVHQPQKGQPRDWRTRADPLAGVWEQELVPLLQREPRIEAMTLYEYLQEHYPGQYERNLRTLQRRVSEWKALHGAPPDVMFELRHSPGEMGYSDFTELKGVTITIAGKPYEHLLYHYRLAYSGWQYVQIVQGGESFIALAEGLQNALVACGGAPRLHRTDSLTAAYHNSGGKHRLTERYEALCRHYGLQSSRNNTGIAHENGSVESSHGYFKRRLVQQLYLRNSLEFATVGEYAQFIQGVVEKLNGKCIEKFATEQAQLQPLPQYRFADYDIVSVRVSCRSTVDLKSVLYTVPERLIGRKLTVHLYHNRWIGYLGQKPVVELPRLTVAAQHAGRRARAIYYRHIIQGLRKKPRALLYCTWTADILPTEQYRTIWQQLLDRFERDSAARLMVEALYIAATQDKEASVAQYLEQQLSNGSLSIGALQQHFQLLAAPTTPEIVVHQHELSSYDQLLHYDPLSCASTPGIDRRADDPHPAALALREPEPASEEPEAVAHAAPLVALGAAGNPGTLELCPIPASPDRVRSNSALSSPHCPCPERVPTACGQVPEQLRVRPLSHPQPSSGDATGAADAVDHAGQQLLDFRTLRDGENASGNCRCPVCSGVGQTSQVLCRHQSGADASASQAQPDAAGDVDQTRPLRSAGH